MNIKNKTMSVPIIQGGMGVGVSGKKLAAAVAKKGGMGVISSVNLGYADPEFEMNPKAANIKALKEAITYAKEESEGRGIVAVNIMTAVSFYKDTCKAAVEAGADAIISGAGLPLNLPEFVKGSNTLFAPIVSGAKAAKVLCKHYSKKYDVTPDFIVIEGHKAGGHLGFSAEDAVSLEDTRLEEILAEVLEVIAPYEKQYGVNIPVFVAGGISDGKQIAHYMECGAFGAQMATRFIATHECDASEIFKRVIVDAKDEDVVIIKSPVGMPARAVKTPFVERILRGEAYPPKKCNGCLTGCPGGDKTPYCISRALVAAVTGDYENGLFFCSKEVEKTNQIMSVSDLIDEIERERNA